MEIELASNQIHKAIQKARHIVVAIHQNPDPDALGSLTAVSEWLKDLGKSHAGFCFGTPLADCSFVNEQRQLIHNHKGLRSEGHDLLIVLDTGDLRHGGLLEVLPKLNPAPKIINIDHHATNIGYGHINLLKTNAASTTEILYDLFKALKVKITPKMASSLLAGIIGDTSGFTNPNTSDQSLQIASNLLKHGAKLNNINDAIIRNKTVAALQTWGTILNRLTHNAEFNIAATVITYEDVNDDPARNSEFFEGIANFLNVLSDTDASLVLRQATDDTIKGSLRANRDDVDVSKIAQIFGGGGHKKSAGFTVKGKLNLHKNGYWQIN